MTHLYVGNSDDDGDDDRGYIEGVHRGTWLWNQCGCLKLPFTDATARLVDRISPRDSTWE
jgi:hypothetical protein